MIFPNLGMQLDPVTPPPLPPGLSKAQGLTNVCKGNLNQHIATNHEERKKTIKCNICDGIFTDKRCLRKHILSVHERKKSFKFQCHVCDGNFNTKQSLNRHMNMQHRSIKERKMWNKKAETNVQPEDDEED